MRIILTDGMGIEKDITAYIENVEWHLWIPDEDNWVRGAVEDAILEAEAALIKSKKKWVNK